MPERFRNRAGEEILRIERKIHPEIGLTEEVGNPNPDFAERPPILERLLNSPISRPLTHTSGPDSR